MSKRPRQDDATATVVFTYESAYNQIVEPGRYVSLSHYFVAHWMPNITPNGLRILIQLRSMGYYNPKDGVQRGEKDIDQKELAALCGMSHSTLKRAFTDDIVLNKYVQRVFRVERDRYGRIVREHYVYVVKMDDVLIPADDARLESMREGADKGGDTPNLPKGQNEPSDGKPKAQNEPSGVQNELPMAQNDLPGGQNDPSYNVSFNTPHTLNTLDTPVAPRDPLSLFSEGGGGEGTAPSAEEIQAVRDALRAQPPPRPALRLAEIQAEWDATPPEGRDRYRPDALRQLQEQGQASPPEKMIEPLMFKLFWVERKGLPGRKTE